jgi:hypothetical protein
MPQQSAHVTAAEISRLAGVTRATVSNWRRRHEDFPVPSGGTDSSPLYDLKDVRSWLDARGHTSAASPAEGLRAALRLARPGVARTLLDGFITFARLSAKDATRTTVLSNEELAAFVERFTAELDEKRLTDADAPVHAPENAGLWRALLACVREQGGQVALDVLVERELEDSAAGGAYETAEPVAELMARLVAPEQGRYPHAVLDPACGGGSLLAAAARLGAVRLLGQDVLLAQAQRTELRLRLEDPKADATVLPGDSLRADAFPGETVDAVLCQPPYGDRDWGHDELAYDPRWAYGVPPRAESELAWNQHVLSHLAPGAPAVVLLPPATASRSTGRRVRAELLRGGAVRAVVALPPGAAQPLHIGLHLWILRRPDPGATPSHRVLFIDASGDNRRPAGTPSRADADRGAIDWDAVTDLVLTHWRAFDADPDAFTDEAGAARAVPVLDLLDDLVDVTPARHVRAAPGAVAPDEVARRAEAVRARLDSSLADLAAAAGRVGGLPAGPEPRAWRAATVADLARGGALTLHRAVRAPGDRDSATYAPDAPVLTAHDVATGTPASGTAGEQPLTGTVPIEPGDVLLPAVAARRPVPVRVADERDEGALLGTNLHLFRPDPLRLDPWFLAGFLSAQDNIAGASTGSTTVQVNARRLRLPLLPLAEQRRYGEAFRHLHELRTATAAATALAAEAAKLFSTGLTTGTLLPPGGAP